MQLSALLEYENIHIQCHDNPDADSIASAFGLYSYFKSAGKNVKLFYSGRRGISKPNLLRMLTLLGIPLEHIPGPAEIPGLLITADCQYGAGNTTKFNACAVAVVDHHVQEDTPPAMHDIRPYLGSCSTLVWKLLSDAGFEINRNLATALYYGLYTDTGAFAEVRHPLDRDLRDNVSVDERAVKILKNSNLTLEDLSLASSALKELEYDDTGRFALVRTEPCDSNILGFVGDLAIQVDKIDTAVIFSENTDGIKYSVRTVSRGEKASDLASWLSAGGLGSGGGHADKAGGYISAVKYGGHCPGMRLPDFFRERIQNYRNSYKLILGLSDLGLAYDGMDLYGRMPSRLGFVDCDGLFRVESTVLMRMLEGDISAKISSGDRLMIGLKGEVYPIDGKKFEETYMVEDGVFSAEFDYPPTVLDKDTGRRVELIRLARPCMSKPGRAVRAHRLESGVKLFTRWDTDNYIRGEAGDWLVSRDEDDLYIVTADLFPRLYRKL